MPLSSEVSSPCGAQMEAGCWPVMTFAGRSTGHALDIKKQNVNHGPSASTSAQLKKQPSPSPASCGGRLEAQVSSTWLTFAAGLALLSLLQQLLFKLLGARLFLLVTSVVQLLYRSQEV